MKKVRIPRAEQARKKAYKVVSKPMKSLEEVVNLIKEYSALGFTNTGGYVNTKVAEDIKKALEKKGYRVFLSNYSREVNSRELTYSSKTKDIEVEW